MPADPWKIPEPPTWVMPDDGQYYQAEEANAKLQEMRQTFNHARIQTRQYVQAVKDLFNSQRLRIRHLEDRLRELEEGVLLD